MWVFVVPNPDYRLEIFHPDDRHVFERTLPFNRFFKVVGETPPYMALLHGVLGTVRVLPQYTKTVASPAFDYFDTVQGKPPRSPRRGIIGEIVWHYNEKRPYYFLLIKGRLHHGRYWASELERVST
jgi:hypothetical protein